MSLSVGQMDAPLKTEWFGGENEIFFQSQFYFYTENKTLRGLQKIYSKTNFT